MRPNRLAIMMSLLLGLFFAGTASGQEGDYGDAPEGVLAYPQNGVVGQFPTCVQVGPAGFVYHSPLGWARFGPGFDTEPDGNAGSCPPPPYDLDECFADNDAGLMMPVPYTIQGGVEVPCVPPGTPLGVVCTQAAWGANVDIHVVNNMPVDGFVNVLMDWDQNGAWAGSSSCGEGLNAPEHVLVNWLVPMGYAGPLSGLQPPPFLIGPNHDFVWTRFTVSERPVQQDWTGEELFEDGETEDYLLAIDPDDTPTQETTWGRIKTRFD